MVTKAIVFDAYGTLFDVNSAAEKCKDKIGNKWESFANFWRITQLEYTWLRSLMKRHKDFWQITEDSLDKSMKVFSIDKNMKNELLNLYKVLSPYKEVEKVLKNLKKKDLKIDGQAISEILTVNGIRFTLEDGSWGLIRASSNKPSLVVVVESMTSDQRKKKIFNFIDSLLEKTGKIGDYDQKL